MSKSGYKSGLIKIANISLILGIVGLIWFLTFSPDMSWYDATKFSTEHGGEPVFTDHRAISIFGLAMFPIGIFIFITLRIISWVVRDKNEDDYY